MQLSASQKTLLKGFIFDTEAADRFAVLNPADGSALC
jgi:hypothetical protein